MDPYVFPIWMTQFLFWKKKVDIEEEIKEYC